MTGTVHVAGAGRDGRVRRCRRSASRSARCSRSTTGAAGRPSARSTTSPTTPTSRRSITIVAGHRRGRQDDRLRAQAQPADRHASRRTSTTSSSRSRRAACTSAARSASSRPRSASSARATAASTTSAARSTAARRCARSTASTRASRDGQVEIGPRYSVNTRAQALLAARPGRAARRHRPVPLPVALLDAASSQEPDRHAQAQAPAPPVPQRLQARAEAPGRAATARQPRRTPAKEAGDHRRRLGRRAHLAVAAPPRWLMFRKVPKGTNWFYTLGSATMFAFLIAGGHRRLPGDVLRPVARRAPTSRPATSPTTSSSASSCAACTSGARP